uniref:SUN domain-containing protein n=1 Tax=Alexandrium monilatum TaxID=311494 RepID=A0A7S4RKT5_9DINO|mmetsp:Transcript_56232/g.176599  ORF Transcript_56232/g.176599 Transcript_56232/m.176599 type:complete len:382 (+) Transcript_56232:97-1242(+)
MPFSPNPNVAYLTQRRTDANLCAEQALALFARDTASTRLGFQVPPAGRSPPRRRQAALDFPPWLRSFGGGCAVLCAALLGIIPFLGTGVVAFLLDAYSGQSAPAMQAAPPQHVVLQAPAAPAVLPVAGGEVAGAAVLTALDGLRRDLQAQEHARKASETATGERVRRIEAALASGAGSGAAAGPLLQAAPESTSEGGDVTSGLGVDWAAWSAGAEIDQAHTSAGLGRDAVGRAARVAAALLPRYRGFAGNVSHPPEVVLASESGPPSRCFTFGPNGSVAIRFPRAVQPLHVALEQRPAWATLRPRAAPRRFEVHVCPAGTEDEQYSVRLGAFEYALEGPRAQAFALELPATAQAVKFVFLSNWGEDHTSVCRLRVLGEAPK